jgi:hypothetical protein
VDGLGAACGATGEAPVGSDRGSVCSSVVKLDAHEWSYAQCTSILLPLVWVAVELNSRSLKTCELCALRDDNPEEEEANIMEVYFGSEVLAGGTRERM